MTRRRGVARIACGVSIGMGCLLACRQAPGGGETGSRSASTPSWFEEIAARTGIGFVHHSGHQTRYYLPEIMGGGAALFDMDNDGFLDLYLVQSGNLLNPSARDGNRLYHNRGDGTFEDVTERSGAGIHGYGMGVAAGDFDNDGYTDLFVTNFGTNTLLRNDGHGHFIDVTAK